MDFYDRILTFFLEIPMVTSWPDMEKVVRAIVSKRPRHWQLPIVAYEATSGEIEQAISWAASLAALQISILIVDDLLDGDGRLQEIQVELASAGNLAVAFQAMGLDLALHAGSASPAQKKILETFLQMILLTSLGQYYDGEAISSEEDYWRIISLKSAPFFAAAMKIGALAAGSSAGPSQQFWKLGCLYGEMVQIEDDLDDALSTPAHTDWQNSRPSLPILYARIVDHPQKERFIELLNTITDPASLQEAQNILIQCGAVSYCFYQLLERYDQAVSLLESMDLKGRSQIKELFGEAILPVQTLLLKAL